MPAEKMRLSNKRIGKAEEESDEFETKVDAIASLVGRPVMHNPKEWEPCAAVAAIDFHAKLS